MRVIIGVITATLVSTASAFAKPLQATIPTLSEWGLIAMIGALGVIGAFVLRKRLTTKVG